MHLMVRLTKALKQHHDNQHAALAVLSLLWADIYRNTSGSGLRGQKLPCLWNEGDTHFKQVKQQKLASLMQCLQYNLICHTNSIFSDKTTHCKKHFLAPFKIRDHQGDIFVNFRLRFTLSFSFAWPEAVKKMIQCYSKNILQTPICKLICEPLCSSIYQSSHFFG